MSSFHIASIRNDDGDLVGYVDNNWLCDERRRIEIVEALEYLVDRLRYGDWEESGGTLSGRIVIAETEDKSTGKGLDALKDFGL